MFGTPAMADRDGRFVQRREELAAQQRREKARQDVGRDVGLSALPDSQIIRS